MKAKTDDLYAIFLLKKNVQTDIIKKILEYSPMAVPELLREWKVAIISVVQGYKSIKSKQDYRIRTGTIYRGRGVSIVTINVSWRKHRVGQRIMTTWLAVLQMSQSAPHVVGIASLPNPHVQWLIPSHVLQTISSLLRHIYSVNTILYLYALPPIISLNSFSNLCLSVTWALSLRS